MTAQELESTLQRGEELVKKVTPYTEIIEALVLKCGGDTSKLTDQEREDLDAAGVLMEPLVRELTMLQGIINSNEKSRLD